MENTAMLGGHGTRPLSGITLCALGLVFGSSDVLAQERQAEDPVRDDELITVWGVRHSEVGRAFAASEGELDFGEFDDRPLLRVGELAEVVPGLAATQHSGTGKANQYFLRGFNLDHGTDFSVTLNGMPVNLRTHGHGQGYLDLNFLIPELVRTIEYRKGPYTAAAGDFSAAGSARFSTFANLPDGFAQIEAGGGNWRRLVGAVNFGDDAGFAALDVTRDDGPWELPEDFEKYSGFVHLNRDHFGLDIGIYHARWRASDQIPLRAIEAGLISEHGHIDPTNGGRTQRFFFNLSYANDDRLAGNIYVQNYQFNLFSNFTYFLNDPVRGDQFEQVDRRWIYGGAFRKDFERVGSRWTPSFGGEFRYDDIDRVGLHLTEERARLGIVREDAVDQISGALWASGLGGLRIRTCQPRAARRCNGGSRAL